MLKLLLLPALLISISLHGQPAIKVEVSSDTIGLGETVDVTYTIENGDGKFIMPDMKGLPVISGPNSSSSFIYQNGKMTSDQSYSFTLMATKEGKIIIPKTYYQSGSDRMTINPVEITVVQSHLPAGSGQSQPEETGVKGTREKRKF